MLGIVESDMIGRVPALALQEAIVLCVRVCAQSCPTLCNPMQYSPPGSSALGILQARILEWVAISFSSPYTRLEELAHETIIAIII